MPALAIREKPRLALSLNLTTTYGQIFRWGPDESDPAYVPSGLGFSSSMPGGFDQLNVTLPRRPESEYPDLGRLSTLTCYGPGRQVAWQGRLESAPRVSGDNMAVTPGAVGWQAHLDDDTGASAVFVDRDLNSWGEMSRARRLADLSVPASVSDGGISPDPSNGIPGVELEFDGNASATPQICERLYDAGTGNYIGSIYYDFVRGTNTTSSYTHTVRTGASDTSFTTATSNLCASASSLGTLSAGSSHRFAALYFQSPAGDGGDDGKTHSVTQRRLTVFGDVGVSKKGTEPDQGFYAADVIAYILGRWCPLLTYTTGANGSISDSSFVIPHLVFRDPTTPGQMVSAANRYHLRDWAVWENPSGGKPLFYYHERGVRGKTWRARVAPAQLEEAGPAVTNLYNGVMVSYSDVDGLNKTAGPTGSSADSTSASLTDSDPLNPANQLGIRRWAQISMNGVSTAAGATEVGRRFLVEAAQYNTSGRAQLVGHVEDDKGVIYPAWRVRAGDTISFIDASDTSPRRVVRASYSDQTKTCSVDLDSPPEGLQATLERLQVALVGVI